MSELFPVRIRSTQDELIIEIPNRLLLQKLLSGKGECSDYPPLPSAPFGEKIRWRYRQQIQVPLLNVRLWGAVIVIISVLVVALRPQFALAWAIALLAGLLLYLYKSQSAFVHFNRSRNYFLIYSGLFPAAPRRYDDRLSAITHVYQSTPNWVSPDSRISPRVVIQAANNRKFIFGEGLNRVECDRVVQEITAWLMLPQEGHEPE